MVLGKLPVPGRPTIWISVGQGPIALAVGAGGGGLDIFTLVCPFFSLSPSLWETARYRLKYCLKGLLNPKPTNQPTLRLYPLTLIQVFFLSFLTILTLTISLFALDSDGTEQALQIKKCFASLFHRKGTRRKEFAPLGAV